MIGSGKSAYVEGSRKYNVTFKPSTNARFFSFVPEESASDPHPHVLLAHELELGKLYKVIMTNESGLYRYDINDTVKVNDFYNRTPVIAFVRKTSDVLNITGEKLHVNQFIMTIKKVSQEVLEKQDYHRPI